MAQSASMKVFTKHAFGVLLTQVDKIVPPMQLNETILAELKLFLLYIIDKVPNNRDHSTGRSHILKSTEAVNLFTKELTTILTNVLNKMSHAMTSKFTIYLLNKYF